MTMLTACVEDVKRTLDEIKPYFLGTKSCSFQIDPDDFKNKKWKLLEKKFHLLQIEVEKQQLVEELSILSKEGLKKVSTRKASPKKFGPSPPILGWGRQPSPEKDTLPPPPPPPPPSKENNEEPKKS